MRESGDPAVARRSEPSRQVDDRIRDAGPGLTALLAEARETWLARVREGQPGAVGAPGSPGWRPFEDAFPTFYQFTNKPR